MASLVSSTNTLIGSRPKILIQESLKNIAAKKYVLCTYNVPRNKLETVTKITPGKRAPSVTMLEEEGWVAISVMVEKRKIADIMDRYVALSPSPKTTKYSCLNTQYYRLEEVGATDILVTNIANSRSAPEPTA